MIACILEAGVYLRERAVLISQINRSLTKDSQVLLCSCRL